MNQLKNINWWNPKRKWSPIISQKKWQHHHPTPHAYLPLAPEIYLRVTCNKLYVWILNLPLIMPSGGWTLWLGCLLLWEKVKGYHTDQTFRDNLIERWGGGKKEDLLLPQAPPATSLGPLPFYWLKLDKTGTYKPIERGRNGMTIYPLNTDTRLEMIVTASLLAGWQKKQTVGWLASWACLLYIFLGEVVHRMEGGGPQWTESPVEPHAVQRKSSQQHAFLFLGASPLNAKRSMIWSIHFIIREGYCVYNYRNIASFLHRDRDLAGN